MAELKEIPRKSTPVDLGTIDRDYAGLVVHVRSNISTGTIEDLDALQGAKELGPIRAALIGLIDDWNVVDPRPTQAGTKAKQKRKLPIDEEGMKQIPLTMLMALIGAIASGQRLPKAAARSSARTTRHR